jgi:DNA protecting protein DprA
LSKRKAVREPDERAQELALDRPADFESGLIGQPVTSEPLLDEYVQPHAVTSPVPSEINMWRLALMCAKGVGARTVLKSFALDASSIDEFEQSLEAITRRKTPALNQLIDRAWNVVNESVEHGVRILAFDDPDYPEPLKRIGDPPPFLYSRGFVRGWSKAVAVIGTREPSDEARDATRLVVTTLSEDPASLVVSGLALGIDTEAHRASLSCGLRTVAVLANGLDSVYPRSNAKLADEIVERGGALLSEVPIGAKATPYNLVARDRLQSGLSAATFLMQSSVEGGSMHTAFFTLEQSRTLLVLRAETDEPEWSGNRFLSLSPKSIAWDRVPERLQRFGRFGEFRRFAVSMSPARLPEIVRLGLKAGFVARSEKTHLSQPENGAAERILSDQADSFGLEPPGESSERLGVR